MSDLNELYQETILEHNKNPRNFREIEGADKEAVGDNPLCGDALRVFVKMDGDTVSDVAFIGSGCAISKAAAYEHELLEYATARLADIPGVTIVGTARDKASVLSFTIEGVHPHDIGTILDQQGIAVRAGHHCAQPVMQFLTCPQPLGHHSRFTTHVKRSISSPMPCRR
jgi:selenocysteine lyase/cysteine desulfurase